MGKTTAFMKTQYNKEADQPIDHYNPVHFHNFQVYRKKVYNK
jgi:hypothetical protein